MLHVKNAPCLAVQPENPILKKTNSAKSPMQLRTSLQRSHYNIEKNIFCKNKTKRALSAQYSMSFSDNPDVIYILVSFKLNIFNDMDKGYYVCDVLDYNTGTWWNCNDEKITQYPVYPMNVYNDLSSD